ncbi:GntR family transcriptional regulator YhfZ [Vibrio aestuarianus]|uniref:GntR family transcriptional regulator YhfZ n=1 Tax=Vibrio aestuarianus TaxID=28171 RepID=UPI00237D126C|nr:GntR family transcriptional regulator YhfZ [Vibrio aestuarianus]MDE1240343.1 hypothetical protein [Vibrio aestuarianus]
MNTINNQNNEKIVMVKDFILKKGTAVRDIARHLLNEEVGNRLDKVSELAERYGISVGYATKAIHYIESEEAVFLLKQGRNGTVITSLDYAKLLVLADIGNVVCAMPLPYTKHYEGLAGGLKSQVTQFPFYFAHMRGASVRAECLSNQVYQMAIMSKLSAKALEDSGELKVALSLGAESYTQRHVLIIKEMSRLNAGFTLRVGVDATSPDQILLTEAYFKGQDIKIIDVPYSECLTAIETGFVDVSIWCPSNIDDLTKRGLSHLKLDIPECALASEAAICINAKSDYLQKILSMQVSIDDVLNYQQQVITGKIVPSY